MRLKKKKKIMELLSTLEEGFYYVKSVSQNKSNLMLSDCYNGLISIFNSVEEEIIKTYINNILKKFEQMINKLNEEKYIGSEIESIIKTLGEIKGYILNNISTELEIVFMPYKSSMWDSMESIWNEAVKDKDRNCYVVPIPYSEKDPSKLC